MVDRLSRNGPTWYSREVMRVRGLSVCPRSESDYGNGEEYN